MAKLICRARAASEVFSLKQSTVIGRGKAADFIVDEETLSRRHARFFPEAGHWYVEDLRSGNGTVVNGVVIHATTALHDGDELTLGKLEIRFEDPADRSTQPVVFFRDDEPVEHLRVLDALPTLSGGRLSSTQRLQLVAETASAIASTIDEEPLFTIVAERLFKIFVQAERACIITVDEQSGALHPRLARTRSGTAETIPVSRTLLDEVIRLRRGIVSGDALTDERFADVHSVVELSLRTVVCAPLVAGDLVLGVLQIDSSDGLRPFNEDDLATLLAIAAITGVALANQRTNRMMAVQQLLSQDLALAKRIQRHFFPDAPPTVPGYAFDSHYSPALGVGGDYYDFIPLSEEHYAVIIADVSGKGISAALYMAKLSSEVRFHSAGKTDAAEIVRRVNKAMVKELTDGMFITMLLIVLNTKTGEIQMASAGHSGPVVRRSNGQSLALQVPENQPLGMPNYGGFEQSTFRIVPGEVVVMFTDGVSEGMNRNQQLFGEPRIHEAVGKAVDATPSGVKEAVLDALESFCGGADQNDDITLICFGPVAR